MPKVRSDKAVGLHCNQTGCTIQLEANVVTDIDPKFMQDALVKKLTIIYGKEGAVEEPVTKMTLPAALEKIIMDGKPTDFNSVTRVPKVKVVSDLMGTKVSNDDIREAWQRMDMPVVEAPDVS